MVKPAAFFLEGILLVPLHLSPTEFLWSLPGCIHTVPSKGELRQNQRPNHSIAEHSPSGISRGYTLTVSDSTWYPSSFHDTEQLGNLQAQQEEEDLLIRITMMAFVQHCVL